MAVDKYLRLLGERDHDSGGTYPQSVAASWAVAFDRLAADDPTQRVLPVLLVPGCRGRVIFRARAG